MANLPKLPNVEGIQVGEDRILLLLEPFIPKTKVPKNLDLLGDKQKRKFFEEMELEMAARRFEHGTLRRGIIIGMDANLNTERFKFKIHDIVYVPNETNTYDVINIDRTPMFFVGPRDIRLVGKSLTEEEVKQWNEDQETWLNTVVYPELESPTPLDRGSKGVSQGGIITDLN